MAKKSKMTSPQKPLVVHVAPEADNGDDGEFYDAEESLANISPARSRHHQEGIQPQGPIADMGNANSTPEEIGAGLRATAQAVPDGATVQTTTTRSEASGAAQRPSTGRLKQPLKSARHSNPPFRNPLAAASAQRALAARHGKRGSAYDLPGDSPVKEQAEAAPPHFSPLKKQKKAARKARNDDVEDAAVVDEADAEQHEWRYCDFFTDAEAQRHEEEVADAAAGAEQDESEAPAPAKRGRGRPLKNSIPATISPKGAAKVGQTEISSETTTARRPKQAKTVPAGTAELSDAPRQTQSKTTAVQKQPIVSTSAKSPVKLRPSQSNAKKRSGGSALDDLNRRRSQALADGDYQPDEPEAVVDEHDEEDEDNQDRDPLVLADDEEELPTAPQVDHIRPSELFEVPELDEDNESDPLPTSGPVRGKKRKAGSQRAQANTKQKRARFGHSVQSGAAHGDDESSQTRLFGQWLAFAEVINKANNIGRSVKDNVVGDRNDVQLTDADVKATVNLCDKAIKLYSSLRTHRALTESEQDPANLLAAISERVDRLRGLDDDHPTNFKDNDRATEIYFHLMRKLVALTKAAILTYEALDTGSVAGGQISFGHARIVFTLLQVIVDLAKSSEKYARPDTDFHVVQPVREFVPILRRISKALSWEIYAHIQSQQLARRVERDRLDRAARAEEGRRRQQHEAIARKWQHKWQSLHTERMLVEGGLMPAAKRNHLQIQDRYYYTEYDQNGEPFQREEIFAFRKGPLPVFIEAAQRVEWTMVELSTLCDGLNDYTGEFVFERIFRKYCGRERELNRFNATEIVVTAAALKEKLVEDRKKNYDGDVEQWILDIPVWTSAHHSEGQENMDEEAMEGVDVTMSGALPDVVEVAQVEV